METDADASGIQTWLFGSVRVTMTTNQTHRFPMSLSRMGSHLMRRHGNRIGGHENGHSFTEQYDPGLIPNAGS